MAERGKMGNRLRHAGLIVRCNRRHFRTGQAADNDHDGNAGGNQRLEVERIGRTGWRYDQPGDAVLPHRGNHLALPVDAFAGIGKKLHIAGRLHDRVDAHGKFRKEAVRQIVDDDTDDFRFRAGLAQVRGAAVVDITKLAHRRIDLGPGPLIDERRTPQHQRDCRFRHACGLRDIYNGHPSASH
ncbi:hypothetical protein D3C72_1795650 [compost metagenome]